MRKSGLIVLFMVFSAVLFAEDLTPSNIDKLAMQSLDYRQFYNMGIQYGNAGLIGKAVLNLKRAALLEPRDKETKTALSYYRSRLGVPPYFFEQTPLEKVLLFPFQFAGLNALFLLGFIMLLFGSVSLFIIFIRKLPQAAVRYERHIRLTGIILFILGLIYLTASVIRYTIIFDRKASVIINGTVLLERPDANAIKITEIQSGIECIIKNSSKDFSLVSSIDGKEGWVSNQALCRLWEGLP